MIFVDFNGDGGCGVGNKQLHCDLIVYFFNMQLFFFSVSATHTKCCIDSICEDQSNDHHSPLAAVDLCRFLYLTNGSGDVT